MPIEPHPRHALFGTTEQVVDHMKGRHGSDLRDVQGRSLDELDALHTRLHDLAEGSDTPSPATAEALLAEVGRRIDALGALGTDVSWR